MQGTEFITEHEKMVHGLANRLRRELSLRGDLDDLIAFGFGGLLEARHRFDPGRGVRFQTFAYHRVRGAMLDGVRKMSQLPRRAHERLQAAAEPTPTAAPTALDRAFTRMGALSAGTVLQGRFGDESPEAVLLKNESVTRLLQALPSLSPRQRVLVRGFYFEGRSIDAMAQELGISKSWASRLHTNALRELREALDAC
ncbi:MAG: sigma-70 family RNA polymerase sigma factor [Myxococcales bacterium]|jgi:RNA polymerase sigma factor for flagellar operon FliA|nr:sigma-70 family RNA polymerase sigma factor [Myxococcales bacterium]